MSTGNIDYEKVIKRHGKLGSDLQRPIRKPGDPIDEKLINNIDEYVVLSSELVESLQREITMAEAALKQLQKHP